MMGLRIPKAHKAISEARRKERPHDVDLRYTIIGLGILGLFVFMVISDVVNGFETGDDENAFQVTIGASVVFMFVLYLVSKLCPAFPRNARWWIFGLCAAACVGYVVLVLFINKAMLPVAGFMWGYCAAVAWVSVRQIAKYCKSDEGAQSL